MPETMWNDEEMRRAESEWRDYQTAHDVSSQRGQTAGIDPDSGRVWIGESAKEVFDQARRDLPGARLFCIRVGYDHYLRKGVRR